MVVRVIGRNFLNNLLSERMKKLIFLLTMCVVFNLSAQDIIVKRNGDELQCRILEVSKNEVKYKRWVNLDGPAFSEKKSDIFMIKYENGEKDMIAHSSPVSESSAVSSGMNSVDPNEYIFEEPTPISHTYLKYTTKGKRESGLIKWGNMLPEEQAKSMLNHDWLDFKKARKESRAGKKLTWVGGSMVVASISIVPVYISKRVNGYGNELLIPIAGFVGLGIPTIIIGRRLHKRGHKNATQIVDKYIEAYENGKKSTSMSVPEFSINSNGNNIAFTVTF
ncbi:MAG: hypothetical protein IIX35_05310 [Paraprevotella sp.]|nr:hypothetical protein [Paraprevotella sp.]